MDKNQFFEKLENILQLETGTIHENLHINEIPDFDSLAWLNVIELLDDELNISVDIDQLTSVNTIFEILAIAGIE